MAHAGERVAVLRELTLRWRRLSPFEERLLAEVRRMLPDAAVSVYDAQVAEINHVQRLPPSWSEIDFYRLRRRKPDWSGVPMFPCTDELSLVEVEFQVAGKRFRARLSSIGGHIFDLVTTPGPRRVAFDPWDAEPRMTLLGDPLRASGGKKEPETLPRQWQEFLRRHPGEPPSGWVFHDEATAYRVALADGVYVILAEREGTVFVLHRADPPGARLFYLRHHDGDPEPLDAEIETVVGSGAQSGDAADPG
jgi:hypothetical protein